MKIAALCFVVLLAAVAAFPNKKQLDEVVNAKLGYLPENLAGNLADSLYNQIQWNSDMESQLNNETYDLVRSGVGCVAGGTDFVNTVFTIADVIQTDPKSWEVYLFGGLYLYAWWQQNGQYMNYMCTYFWTHIN